MREEQRGVGKVKSVISVSGEPTQEIGQLLTYALSPRPGARPTGMLASTPIRNEESAAIAAVAVIKSWRTSAKQVR